LYCWVVVLQQGSSSGVLHDCWATAAVQPASDDPRLLALLDEEQEGP
jgi:hypothetical protein